MSIVTEIERLQSAKSSIKTAIENKGVVVGYGTLDTYAEKIDAIEVGGGSDLEINDCSYLFYQGGRHEQMEGLLKLCKNVTKMNSMFYYDTQLREIDLSSLNTENLIEASGVFNRCSNLTKCICKINTSKVKTLNAFFYENSRLKELDISTLDFSSAEQVSDFFYKCLALTNLDLSHINAPLAKYLGSFAYGCTGLTDFVAFNADMPMQMGSFFNGCTKLKNADLSRFYGGTVTSAGLFFNKCSSLENLIYMNDYGKGFTNKTANDSNYSVTLSACTNLTHDSLMDVINKLYDLNLTYNVAGGGTLYTQKLVIGSTNLAKLTEEEKLIPSLKGWTLS